MNQIKELLIKSGIPVEEVIEEIKGCEGKVVKAKVDNQIVFFKFLPKNYQEQINKEIKIVNILRGSNCKVPTYYEYNNQNVFEDINYVFYATYEVKGYSIKNQITKDLLKEIMVEIAKMHKVLENIPVLEKEECDYDRLKLFYEKNKDFFDNHNLSVYIERIINRDYKKEKVSYIHADINFNNVFAENNHMTSFIDFTDLRVGNIEDDLGKLFQNILYLNLSEIEKKELIQVYETELGKKINLKNLLISVVYRIIYRYYNYVMNNEGLIEDYKDQTEEILHKIVGG